ncbi:MAG: SUMF1/EgtB/PvdO family nonheme iron enzyme [Chloroflexi bacterium]|nr:SUMF1/EgtB/PvdO family nonheme iron enzyme [Chloroflexota bacterium]
MPPEYVGTPEGVLRGGSWNNNGNNLRVANRNNNEPSNRNNNIGFRCARSLPPKLRFPWPECRVFTDARRVPGK